MRSVIEVWPTTSYQMASPTERLDQMESLARVLMGLSHPVQLLATAHETAGVYDWPRPPTIERRWLAVVTVEDGKTPEWQAHAEATLEWRTKTLKSSLEGVGLRCDSRISTDISDSRPGRVLASRGNVEMDTSISASLVLRRWPREVAPGWLGQALAGDIPVDVALHIQPQDPQRIARFLKRQHLTHSQANAARPDAGAQLGSDDAERVRRKLIARTDRPCKVAVVFTVRAHDLATLNQRMETVKHELGLALADARPAAWEHDRGLEATLPLGRCKVGGAWRTLDCTSVASTWIFQPATVNHANGADLGTTHEGGMLVRLDPFDPSLESFGGLIVGKTGVGKSYLLKLIVRRLHGVDVLIVDRRRPSEYADIPGVQLTSLAGLNKHEQSVRLRQFIVDLWELAKRDPRPRLLVLDELYALLKDRELADLVEEIAREGRHFFLSLWIATQQVRELLNSGEAVLDNATIKVYLRQNDNDLDKLCDAVGLTVPARRFLRGAARGQALLDVGGMLIPVDIQASPSEHSQITTDPREKHNGSITAGLVAVRNGSGHTDALPVGASHPEMGVRGFAAAHPGPAVGE